jgi:hypothetical protein
MKLVNSLLVCSLLATALVTGCKPTLDPVPDPTPNTGSKGIGFQAASSAELLGAASSPRLFMGTLPSAYYGSP